MTIYIEYVLIDNLVINALILLLVGKSLKLNLKNSKIFVSSLMGAIFALMLPVIVLPVMLLTLLKIKLAILMVNVLKKYVSMREYFLTLALFFAYTFILGGACYGFMFMFGVVEFNYLSFTYSLDVPIGFVLIVVFSVAYFMLGLIKSFYVKKNIKNFVYKIKLCNNKSYATINAFLDTGNRLCDVKGEPITVISYKAFSKITENIDVASLLLGNLSDINLKNAEYKTFYSASGKQNKILVFEVDEMHIFMPEEKKTFNNVKLALSLKKFKDCINYDALLNPKSFNF